MNANKLYKFVILQLLFSLYDISITVAAFFGTTVRQVSLQWTVSNHTYTEVCRTLYRSSVNENLKITKYTLQVIIASSCCIKLSC